MINTVRIRQSELTRSGGEEEGGRVKAGTQGGIRILKKLSRKRK